MNSSKGNFNLPSLLYDSPLCLSPSTCSARWRNGLVTIQGPLPHRANNCRDASTGIPWPGAPWLQVPGPWLRGIIPRGQQPCPCHTTSPVDFYFCSWLRGIAPSLAASSPACHTTSPVDFYFCPWHGEPGH